MIIHLWCSGLDESGGIQHYTKFCLETLLELYPDCEIRVFAKNDKAPLGSLPPRVSHHVFGQWPARLRTLIYAIAGLSYALWERPAFAFATHPHFMKALRWLAPKTQTLVSAHGTEVWGHLNGILGKALRQASGVLPVSRFTADVLQTEGGISPDRLRVVPNTFREDLFSPGPKPSFLLERYALTRDQPVLLTIARLAACEQLKGQDHVIRALPLLIKRFPDLRYVIGGRGDDEPRLRRITEDLGLKEHVIFAGFIPESELADHYRLADLYVMPSRSEGFGIVFIESLACGRACIAGNLDASNEALDNGRLGFVVNPLDSQAIADAVHRFFSHEHDQPWLHEPETLHREVVRLFGKAAFRRQFNEALKDLLHV